MKINVKNDREFALCNEHELWDISETPLEKSTTTKVYSQGSYQINKGDRLAQLLIVPIATPELQEVNEFINKTSRGTNGFGSTGYSK